MTNTSQPSMIRVWIARVLIFLLLGWVPLFVIPLEMRQGPFAGLSFKHQAVLVASAALWPVIVYAMFRREFGQMVQSRRYRLKALGFSGLLLGLTLIYGGGFFVIDPPIRGDWNALFGGIFALAIASAGAIIWDAVMAAARRPEFWLSVVSVVVSLVIAEFGARYYVRNVLQDPTLRAVYDPANDEEQVRSKYIPHHYSLYAVNPDWHRGDARGDNVNSRGFRGPEIAVPKPADTYRIVAIGGSTTYGTNVPTWRDAYPAQLERALREDHGYTNVEVINGGVGGYSSWESLIHLEMDILQLQPDLVIVYQNLNDVHARIVPPDQYRGDNGGHRKAWDFDKVRQAQSFASRIPSVLWVYLGTTFQWFDTQHSLTLDDIVSQPCSGLLASTSCLGMTPVEALAANPPTYYERNIRSMVGASQASGADVLLLTWAYDQSSGSYTSREQYRIGIAEHNEVMRQLGSEMDVLFYDFAADMPEDEQYYVDGRHMTTEGNRLRGELIADYLAESGVIPLP